jgi:chaperonin GroES
MAQQTQNKLSIRPLGDRVVAQRLEQEETLKGGLYLPDSAKKKQESAKVIAVGPGHMTEEGKVLPMPVAIGDVILVDKYAGQEVTIDDVDYIIIRASEIVATIN